jgi:hypothetical protein
VDEDDTDTEGGGARGNNAPQVAITPTGKRRACKSTMSRHVLSAMTSNRPTRLLLLHVWLSMKRHTDITTVPLLKRVQLIIWDWWVRENVTMREGAYGTHTPSGCLSDSPRRTSGSVDKGPRHDSWLRKAYWYPLSGIRLALSFGPRQDVVSPCQQSPNGRDRDATIVPAVWSQPVPLRTNSAASLAVVHAVVTYTLVKFSCDAHLLASGSTQERHALKGCAYSCLTRNLLSSDMLHTIGSPTVHEYEILK